MRYRPIIAAGFAFALIVCLAASSASAGTRGSSSPASGSIVALETNYGTITIQLFRKQAPITTANFIKYVKSGFYDGTIFHRVISNFMIQGGGFTRSYTKKATRPAIRNEADNGLQNVRGTLAMARTPNPHSATAQFFINLKNNSFLNHTSRTRSGWGYCVFGKVIRGLNVVDKIRYVRTRPRGAHQNAPVTAVVIRRARIVR